MSKTAEQIMSDHLITTSTTESVISAYHLMKKHVIRHLHVVDQAGHIVGILSDRDVQRCICFDLKNRSAQLDVELSIQPDLRVMDVMSCPVHKVHGDVLVRDVAQRILNEKLFINDRRLSYQRTKGNIND